MTKLKKENQEKRKGVEGKHQEQHSCASHRAYQQGCEARLPKPSRERRPWQQPPRWEALDWGKRRELRKSKSFSDFFLLQTKHFDSGFLFSLSFPFEGSKMKWKVHFFFWDNDNDWRGMRLGSEIGIQMNQIW